MKKAYKSLTKSYEESERKLNDISYELYGKNLSLKKLGKLSLSLNEKMKDNENLLYEVINMIESYNKGSARNILICTILSLISIGICFINLPIGLVLTALSVVSVYKYKGCTEVEELNELLLELYGQKSRITSYKNGIIEKVKSTSKNINNDVWVGEELEMLFDLSVRYVEMLLEGAEPDLESPYIEMIVKELLKDEDHPNASITELLELAKEKRNKEMVLKKAFTE